jgi:hypothetical protein
MCLAYVVEIKQSKPSTSPGPHSTGTYQLLNLQGEFRRGEIVRCLVRVIDKCFRKVNDK